MGRRTANFFIVVLTILLMLGLTMIAAHMIKPVQIVTTTTIWVRTTIPRTLTNTSNMTVTSVVQVKDVIPIERLFVDPTTELPYEAFCAFAGTHGTAGQFIENISVYGFFNLDDERNQLHYDTTFDMIVYLNTEVPCEDEYAQSIIRDSIPFIYSQEAE